MYRAIPRPLPPQPKRRHKLWIILGAIFGVFLLCNLALLLLYSGKTYPRATVAGHPFGNVAFTAAPEKLKGMRLLPDKFDVDYGKGGQPFQSSELGIAIDYDTLQTSLHQRHWLPVANLFARQDTPLELDIDDATLQKQLTTWAGAVASDPVNARIEQQVGQFTLIHQKNGNHLDTDKAKASLITAVRQGRQSITINPEQKNPEITDATLAAQLKALQSAGNLSLTYSYSDKKQAASKADIVSWYRKDGASYTPAIPEIKAYLASLGSAWQAKFSNMDAAVAATRQALDGQGSGNSQPFEFKLQGSAFVAPKTLTYCTAVRGVDTAQLTELNRKLAATLADERGWSLGGQVRYVHATTGCDFTVWLSAANQMASFGSICDAEWSCQVTPNVVINFNRWTGASPTWNAAGGNLNDYDSMVINHESGHWHGFDHVNCPGSGQPAPVMQQQSIDLQGCTFNPWPTSGEQAALRAQLGV